VDCAGSENLRYVLKHVCSKVSPASGGSSPRGEKRAAEDDVAQSQEKQCKRNFTETVSELHARYILSLTDKEIASQFWDVSDDVAKDGKKRDIKEHTLMVKAYCRNALANGGETNVTYKYSRAVQESGHMSRLFAMIGALQAMQGKIRAFLCAGKVKDLDMINAHLVLLLDWVKTELKDEMACPLLEQYVANRGIVLRDHRLKKRQVLIALNCDELATSHKAAVESTGGAFYTKNKWLKDFHAEKDRLVRALYARLSATTGYDFPVTNEDNMYSSWMNKVLCMLENECLQKAVAYLEDLVHSLIFDGLHADASVDDSIVDELDALTAPVKWAIKPMVSEIVVPPTFNPENCLDYAMQKQKLEFWPCGMVRHAVVLGPGGRKYLRVYEHFEETQNYGIQKRWAHDLYSETDFKAAAREFRVEGAKGDMSIFDPWMDDSTKAKYQRVDFTPLADGAVDKLAEVGGVYNMFRGFAATKLDSFDPGYIKPYLDLVYHLVGENQEYAEYVLNWQAYIYQKPKKRTGVSLVFRGAQGTGKDTFNDINDHIMGMFNHYLHRTAKMDEAMGNFNGCLKAKLMLQFNEIGAVDGSKYDDLFKDLITADQLTINEKHRQPVNMLNYINLMVFTNLGYCPIKFQKGDRRFVAFKTSDKLKGNVEFFNKVHQLIRTPLWINHVYTFLMSRNLSNFVPKDDRPLTEEYLKSQAMNIPDVFMFLHEVCDQNFPNWFNHALPREGVDFKFMGKKKIKAAYAVYRDEHFDASDRGFSAKTLWRSFDDTDGAIKLNQFIGPGSDTPGEFYCIYPDKLKAYLLEHHPKRYDQVDHSSGGDFIIENQRYDQVGHSGGGV
jgi:hypothetical protein